MFLPIIWFYLRCSCPSSDFIYDAPVVNLVSPRFHVNTKTVYSMHIPTCPIHSMYYFRHLACGINCLSIVHKMLSKCASIVTIVTPQEMLFEMWNVWLSGFSDIFYTAIGLLTGTCRFLSISIYIYISICIWIRIYIYIYFYICIHIYIYRTYVFLYLSSFWTAVAVFRKPNAIPFNFSIDLVLNFLLSWLLLRLPSTGIPGNKITSTAARQFDIDLSRARGRKPWPKITWSSRLGVDAAGQLLAHH